MERTLKANNALSRRNFALSLDGQIKINALLDRVVMRKIQA